MGLARGPPHMVALRGETWGGEGVVNGTGDIYPAMRGCGEGLGDLTAYFSAGCELVCGLVWCGAGGDYQMNLGFGWLEGAFGMEGDLELMGL